METGTVKVVIPADVKALETFILIGKTKKDVIVMLSLNPENGHETRVQVHLKAHEDDPHGGYIIKGQSADCPPPNGVTLTNFEGGKGKYLKGTIDDIRRYLITYKRSAPPKS